MKFDDIQVNSLKTRCTFRLSPTHVAYANTLRRIIMTGVETIGFRAEMTSKGTTTDVAVKTNDTPMTNEMLAHRIGLLPIHIKNPIEFEAEKYTFTLAVSANPDTIRQVTCADFKVTKDRGEGLDPDELDPLEFFRPHPITKDTCLIATLMPGAAKIELTAKPSKGTGREHARFQPTSLCAYTYTKDTDEEKIKAHFDSWLREAKKIEGLSEESDKPKYDMYMREFNTMEAARVFVTDEAGNPNSFDFRLESVGVLDVPYIVGRACDIGISMVGKYTTLGTTTDPKAFPDDLEIVPTRSRIIGAFDFLLKGHDHTLGNLLQTWLSENNMNSPVLTAPIAPAPPPAPVAASPSASASASASVPTVAQLPPATATATATAPEEEEEEEAATAQAGGARSSNLVPITYVGYEIPHPLRDEMVLRIAVESGKQMDAQRAFAQACSGCADIFKEMRNAWNRKVNPGLVAAEAAQKSAVAGATLKRKSVAKPKTSAPAPAPAPVENIEVIRSALKSAVAPPPVSEPPKPTVNLEAARSALAAAAAPVAPVATEAAPKSAVLRRKK